MSDVLYANTALIPFLGHGHAGAAAWIRMDKAERRRLAMAAARDRARAKAVVSGKMGVFKSFWKPRK